MGVGVLIFGAAFVGTALHDPSNLAPTMQFLIFVLK
jgi:hypothetical protein